MKKAGLCLLILTFIFKSYSAETKTILHLATVPVIEGLGVYSSVMAVKDGNNQCKAAGITAISLLAINAGLGAFTYFGKSDEYGKLRTIHRIIGFTAATAGLWLTIASADDSRVKSHVKYTSGAYTLTASVPIFIFKF